jgi:nucleotide-binding universal stress UspA family protein
MPRILLAYDGSEASRHAAKQAADLAVHEATQVDVLVVGELAPSGYGTETPIVEAEVFTEVATEGVELLRSLGISAHGHVVWGRPAEEIVKAAEVGGYGTIVLGHAGRGRLEGLLLGSVAKHVIDHAHCSVLVVR